MAVIDLDRFEDTAAWLEFCDGMSRFAAETEAARRQGFKRYEVMNAIRERNSERGGDIACPAVRNAAYDVSDVQRASAQEARPLPVGQLLAGWCGLALLALPVVRGWLV